MKKVVNTNSFKNRLKRFAYKCILQHQNFILIVSSKKSNKKKEQAFVNYLKNEGILCLRLKTKVIKSLPFFSKISKSLTGELFFIYPKNNDLDRLNLKALSEISKTYNILYSIYNNRLFSFTKIKPLLQKSKGSKVLTSQDIIQQISVSLIGSFFPIVGLINKHLDKKLV